MQGTNATLLNSYEWATMYSVQTEEGERHYNKGVVVLSGGSLQAEEPKVSARHDHGHATTAWSTVRLYPLAFDYIPEHAARSGLTPSACRHDLAGSPVGVDNETEVGRVSDRVPSRELAMRGNGWSYIVDVVMIKLRPCHGC
ncbi:hypothetical protein C8J57DRAFT_1474230 [Mycena rebaudengoi]|nr:hypothetical protein C8J57DRAFT_1474230 [Mycena rebaudengoi]